jgi:hypothetical protein
LNFLTLLKCETESFFCFLNELKIEVGVGA